jgi:cell shape-determining protein MreC
VALLLALVVLFFLSQLFFAPKTYLASRLGRAFQAPVVFIQSLFNRVSLSRQIQTLQLENQSLRAQLVELIQRPQFVEEGKELYVSASIYSYYPLNVSDELLINVGSEQGISEGMAVFADKGILLGQVIKTYAGQSVVKTILTPDWEIPVKIGANKVDALYVGGHSPKLTLISKKKVVLGGETVVSASKDLPYSIELGQVGELRETVEGVFREADIIIPYQMSDIETVLVRVK